MAFSTDAATSVFLTTYGAGLRGMISSTVEGNAATVAERMGSLWAQTHIELDKLEGIERHVPEEGRTLAEDLADAVVVRTTELFAELKPKYNSGKRVNNTIATTGKTRYEAKMLAKQAGSAADRAAAASFAGPPGLPRPIDMSTPVKNDRSTTQPSAGPDEIPSKVPLVRMMLARANGETQEEANDGPLPGNGSGEMVQSATPVPPPLLRAARRLMDPGPPGLRVDHTQGELALHMLQEKWSFTDWAEAQGMHGATLREAKTHARCLELGVADYGVRYLMSRTAEVAVRRLLALALTAASGNHRLGAQLEELPAEGVLAALPDSLVKTLYERLKLDLKIEQMAKGEKK